MSKHENDGFSLYGNGVWHTTRSRHVPAHNSMISQCNHNDGQAWIRLDLVLSHNLAQCATVHIFLREEERNNRFRRLHYFTGRSVNPPWDTYAAFFFTHLDTFADRRRTTSNDCSSLYVQPGRIGHAGPAVAPALLPPSSPADFGVRPPGTVRAARSGHVRNATKSDGGRSR